MDIDHFLAPIREFELDPSKYDINKLLFDFQRQINTNIFYQLSPNNDLNEIFKIIWSFLLKASNNSSSSARIAACKAIGTFLTWITPFFPEPIRNSFIDITKSMTDDMKNSAVIASSYAFLSSFIAEPLLPEFLKSTQSFDQFILNDISSSEHSASIISKFSHFGQEWMKNILNQFLHQIDENQDRNLIRAISSIIKNDPTFYIQLVLDFAKPQIHKFYSLLTFIISTYQDDIISTIDLLPIASAAIDTISNDQTNLSDLDSSLQILAIRSASFEFSATSNNDTTCDMKITNKTGFEKQATIELKKVISMPSFYSLRLPLNLLKPNQETDSVLVLSAKFKSIASNEQFDTNEVFSIFEPFLRNAYNEVTSSAIQAFSICINSILSIVPLKKFYSILRRVLFTKPSNWYHSFDILRVIKSIDSPLFIGKMSEKCFFELLNTLIEFCLCENESLSADSMEELVNKTTVYNLSKVADMIVEKADFFDSLKLDRCVSTLTVILTNFTIPDSQNENLLFFSQKLIEAVPMYYDSVNFLSHVFTFFSVFTKANHQGQKSVINAAYFVAFSTIEIISGQPIKSTSKIDGSPYFKELVRNDLASRGFDIIADSRDDQKAFIYPLKCALSFLFKNAPKNGATITAMNSYRLLPFECAVFFEKLCESWEGANSENSEIFSSLLSILRTVNDERVHSTWCRICLKMSKRSEMSKPPEFKEVVNFLMKMAAHFLSCSSQKSDTELTDASVPLSYIEFYYKEASNDVSVPAISDFLNRIQANVLKRIVKSFPQLLEIVPSLKSKPIQLDDDSQKDIESKSENNDEIDLKKLSEKVDNNKLFECFEESLRLSNIPILKEVIQLMANRKMTIKMNQDEFEFPPETIPVVSCFFAKNNLTFNGEEIDLLKTLRESLGEWRPYCIGALKKGANGNKLLNELISIEKVKKSDILCLSSLVGTIDFDNELLFKLSAKLLFESTKTDRFRNALKLLSTVISTQKVAIPPDFLSSMAKALSPSIEKVDSDGISLALLLIAQKVGFPQELVKFTDEVIKYGGYRSTAHGRIIQIYIGVSASFPSVAQKISEVFPDLTVSYLKSYLPSRFNLGCRLFEQAVLSIKPPTIGPFLSRGIDIVVNRYNGLSKYPSSIVSATRAVVSFISRDGIGQHQAAFLRTLNKMALSLDDACFITFISAMSIVLQRFPSNPDVMKRFTDSFFDSVFSKSGFNNGNSFKFARLCLLERLKVIKSEISRERLVGKAADAWMSSLRNYSDVSQLFEWWKIIECHFSAKRMFSVFDSLCLSVLKKAGFGVVFPTVLRVFLDKREKCKDLNEFKKFIDDVYNSIGKKSQKDVFDEMKKLPTKIGPNEIEKCKELVKLALSEND